MRCNLRTAFGLAVVFWSFALAGELQAGIKEEAKRAMDKFQNHYEFFEKLDLDSFDQGPISSLNYFELLHLEIEWIDERKQPKFAEQFDQILDITLRAVKDANSHENGIRDSYLDAIIENLSASTAFFDQDWKKCIEACQKGEAHLEKLELHLSNYPQKIEFARHAVFRLYEFLGKTKKGIKSPQKSENKAQK